MRKGPLLIRNTLILLTVLLLVGLPFVSPRAQDNSSQDLSQSDYPAEDIQDQDNPEAADKPAPRLPQSRLPRLPRPAGAVGAGGQAAPQALPGSAPDAGDKVSLSFKDVDIKVFIQFVAKLTGKTYVVSDKVTGRVTVLTPGPVTVEEAVRIFGSVLEVKGYVTVKSGDVIMVVPAREGRWQGATEVQSGEGGQGSGKEMVTRVLTLEYASAETIKRNIRPLAGLYANVAAYADSNTLVITDVASNVNRLVAIIRALDRPGVSGLIKVVPLKHANAKDLAKALEELFSRSQTQRATAKVPVVTVVQAQLKVLADERTNSLILLGEKGDIEKALETIQDLDRAEVQGRYNINVIRLRYAVAEELATVFNQLSGAASTVPQAATGKDQTNTPPGEKIKLLSGDIRVVAEPATNSLIISADPSEFRVIEGIVAKLDIPRTMVYVETVILEMSASKSLEFGIDWSAAATTDDGFIFGGSGGLPTGGVPEASSPGLNLGFMGGSVKFGDIEIPNLSALVRAVQTDSDIRVVATPQILTADNEEASIQVATNLPFVTRSDTDTDTNSTVQVYEYKDVGFSLKVTPRISDGDNVRLNVEAEAKSVVSAQTTDSEGNTLLAPTTNVRQAKTVILTRNNEIVAIGGLINQEAEDTGNQVPCLGSIPVLGWGFKSTKDTSKRTNLLIFLAPHILASEEAVRAFSEEKLRQGHDFTPPEKKDLLSPIRPKRVVPDIFKEMTGSGSEKK